MSERLLLVFVGMLAGSFVGFVEAYGALLLKSGRAEDSREVIHQLEKPDPDNPDLPQLRSQLQKLNPGP